MSLHDHKSTRHETIAFAELRRNRFRCILSSGNLSNLDLWDGCIELQNRQVVDVIDRTAMVQTGRGERVQRPCKHNKETDGGFPATRVMLWVNGLR